MQGVGLGVCVLGENPQNPFRLPKPKRLPNSAGVYLPCLLLSTFYFFTEFWTIQQARLLLIGRLHAEVPPVLLPSTVTVPPSDSKHR